MTPSKESFHKTSLTPKPYLSKSPTAENTNEFGKIHILGPLSYQPFPTFLDFITKGHL